MNTKGISKIILDMEEELEQLATTSAQKLLNKLLNLIEIVTSENEKKSHEIQNLRDENARLKGEQGKPNIKPNKNNADISSETDRKNAEELPNEKSNRTGYKLSESSLNKLQEQKLPAELLEKLKLLNGRKYDNEEIFLAAITSCIGQELDESIRSLVLKYAQYKKRKRNCQISK